MYSIPSFVIEIIIYGSNNDWCNSWNEDDYEYSTIISVILHCH